jgi:hypothetical protein
LDLAKQASAPLHVRNRLVSVVSLAVGEEVVDEHADNGEDEDDESPENLVRDGTVGLENFNYSTDRSASAFRKAAPLKTGRRMDARFERIKLTPSNDI